MAMNKWWEDTQEGLKTNPFCRYLLIYGTVSLFLFTFVGWGFVFVWHAIVSHLLIAIAPFSLWAVKALSQLGFPYVSRDSFRNRSRFFLWYFVGRRLITGTLILAAGVFAIYKANFSLLSLVLFALNR
jgi:hypothetical protein